MLDDQNDKIWGQAQFRCKKNELPLIFRLYPRLLDGMTREQIIGKFKLNAEQIKKLDKGEYGKQ